MYLRRKLDKAPGLMVWYTCNFKMSTKLLKIFIRE